MNATDTSKEKITNYYDTRSHATQHHHRIQPTASSMAPSANDILSLHVLKQIPAHDRCIEICDAGYGASVCDPRHFFVHL